MAQEWSILGQAIWTGLMLTVSIFGQCGWRDALWPVY